jgi:DNA-binding CsgD family transcriptional regulator
MDEPQIRPLIEGRVESRIDTGAGTSTVPESGPNIERLSNRHRDVLRGVAALRKSKQIAVDLGIAPGTVDGYIADAVRILGAADRGDAARMLAQHDRLDTTSHAPPSSARLSETPPSEITAAEIPASEIPASETPVAGPPSADPGKSGGQSPWVAAPPPTVSEIAQPVVEPETVQGIGRHTPISLAGLLPIRRTGQRTNDLPVVARLLWIPAIAVILAVGFGMLASGLTVLAALIERLGHLSG